MKRLLALLVATSLLLTGCSFTLPSFLGGTPEKGKVKAEKVKREKVQPQDDGQGSDTQAQPTKKQGGGKKNK